MLTRHRLKEQLDSLRDLKGVLVAMKNIALMETKKVVRLSENQHRSIQVLEQVTTDFLSFNQSAQLALYPENPQVVFLVLGSERGFCGDFNEIIINRLLNQLEIIKVEAPLILTVGSKLGARLQSILPGIEQIEGASFSEEVETVLCKLMSRLEQVRKLRLIVVYHDGDDNDVRVLEPLAPPIKTDSRCGNPPRLNIDADIFISLFLQNYLLTILQYIFYGSLLRENNFRLRHLDHAVRRMDERQCALKSKSDALRQEEITEELEVIMLSSRPL